MNQLYARRHNPDWLEKSPARGVLYRPVLTGEEG